MSGGQTKRKFREVNFYLLLTGLLVLLLAGPLVRDFFGWQDPVIVRIVFGVSSVLFVTSLTNDQRVLILALFPAIAMLLSAAMALAFESLFFYCLMLVSALVFCALAVKYAGEEVFLSDSVNLNKIVGSISIFLLLVVDWAIMYELLELFRPGSYTGLEEIAGTSRFDEFAYFSLVTITTLGYGDIAPASLTGGVLAGLEAVVGVFYIAVLVASLVGDLMLRKTRAS